MRKRVCAPENGALRAGHRAGGRLLSHSHPGCQQGQQRHQRRVRHQSGDRAGHADAKRASNLDAIIDEGTLTIGWVGPALLGILIAAFGWASRAFEWLGTLATRLFSGEWRE